MCRHDLDKKGSGSSSSKSPVTSKSSVTKTAVVNLKKTVVTSSETKTKSDEPKKRGRPKKVELEITQTDLNEAGFDGLDLDTDDVEDEVSIRTVPVELSD